MKTITAKFRWPESDVEMIVEGKFFTLPGSCVANWNIPHNVPKYPTPTPKFFYAETFESEMQALAAASGATVEIAERGEWVEMAE